MRRLTAREKDLLREFIPATDLDQAVVVDGRVPWFLRRKFRAITLGNRIYLRPGAYNPDTAAGLALLAHELVHVGQYRRGMNWLTYLWSARYGYRNSRYEQEARTVQERCESSLSGRRRRGQVQEQPTKAATARAVPSDQAELETERDRKHCDDQDGENVKPF